MTSLAAGSYDRTHALFPRALVRLCGRAQRDLWGLRLARVYGLGIGISYSLLALGIGSDAQLATSLWSRCLSTASWVAGVGALSLARDLASRDAEQGVLGLARLRGFGDAALERARTLAGALRLASAIALPGLLVALAALLKLRTATAALQALALVLMTLPYAALLGATLALTARLSSRLLPERGRWLFLALALGPWLLALGTQASIPSLPGAFAWLLQKLAGSVR